MSLNTVHLSRIHLLPSFTFFIFAAILAVVYIHSLVNNSFDYLPYVSEVTDDGFPSLLFSLALNFISIICLLIYFVRYSFVHIKIDRSQRKLALLNLFSLFVGVLVSIAIFLTANFKSSSLRSGHYVAAVLLFICHPLYCVIQTFLGRFTTRSWRTTFVRMSMILFLVVGAALTFVGSSMVNIEGLSQNRNFWSFCAVCEICTLLVSVGFVLTFIPEFREMSVSFVFGLRNRKSSPELVEMLSH